MARPLRIEYPGAIYHITSRGNARQKVFVDNADCTTFLEILAKAMARFNWLCHAYCLIGNHYHLLIETVDPTLARGMRHLNGVFTQAFNRQHKRSGHLFQGRYKAILVEKDSHLLELARYVVLNPVRARMVRSCKDWRWSSYRATAGLDSAPPFLTTEWILSQFGHSPSKARKAYRRFVLAGRGEPVWGKLKGQIYYGSDEFIERHIPEGSRAFREIPREQRLVDRPPIEDIFRTTSEEHAIATAYREYGYRLREIADFLGVHYSTVSRRLRKQEGQAP
jgi:REP element-mobilizing transposase RayT